MGPSLSPSDSDDDFELVEPPADAGTQSARILHAGEPSMACGDKRGGPDSPGPLPSQSSTPPLSTKAEPAHLSGEEEVPDLPAPEQELQQIEVGTTASEMVPTVPAPAAPREAVQPEVPATKDEPPSQQAPKLERAATTSQDAACQAVAPSSSPIIRSTPCSSLDAADSTWLFPDIAWLACVTAVWMTFVTLQLTAYQRIAGQVAVMHPLSVEGVYQLLQPSWLTLRWALMFAAPLVLMLVGALMVPLAERLVAQARARSSSEPASKTTSTAAAPRSRQPYAQNTVRASMRSAPGKARSTSTAVWLAVSLVCAVCLVGWWGRAVVSTRHHPFIMTTQPQAGVGNQATVVAHAVTSAVPANGTTPAFPDILGMPGMTHLPGTCTEAVSTPPEPDEVKDAIWDLHLLGYEMEESHDAADIVALLPELQQMVAQLQAWQAAGIDLITGQAVATMPPASHESGPAQHNMEEAASGVAEPQLVICAASSAATSGDMAAVQSLQDGSAPSTKSAAAEAQAEAEAQAPPEMAVMAELEPRRLVAGHVHDAGRGHVAQPLRVLIAHATEMRARAAAEQHGDQHKVRLGHGQGHAEAYAAAFAATRVAAATAAAVGCGANSPDARRLLAKPDEVDEARVSSTAASAGTHTPAQVAPSSDLCECAQPAKHDTPANAGTADDGHVAVAAAADTAAVQVVNRGAKVARYHHEVIAACSAPAYSCSTAQQPAAPGDTQAPPSKQASLPAASFTHQVQAAMGSTHAALREAKASFARAVGGVARATQTHAGTVAGSVAQAVQAHMEGVAKAVDSGVGALQELAQHRAARQQQAVATLVGAGQQAVQQVAGAVRHMDAHLQQLGKVVVAAQGEMSGKVNKLVKASTTSLMQGLQASRAVGVKIQSRSYQAAARWAQAVEKAKAKAADEASSTAGTAAGAGAAQGAQAENQGGVHAKEVWDQLLGRVAARKWHAKAAVREQKAKAARALHGITHTALEVLRDSAQEVHAGVRAAKHATKLTLQPMQRVVQKWAKGATKPRAPQAASAA